MDTIKAIPRKLLIHTVTHQKTQNSDRWGNSTDSDGTELSFVRIEPSSRLIRDKNNAEVQISAILFYDCRNSRPRGVTFCEDDIIVFQGQKHRIQSIEQLYDERHLHHYELGMVKHA